VPHVTDLKGVLLDAGFEEAGLADPIQRELIHQISAAWEYAKQQLDELRAAVKDNTELAQTQLKSNALARDKDVAYRNLGEAVWQLVKKGKLALPGSLQGAQKTVKAAEDKAEAHAREINELLKEGSEVADRQAPKSPQKTGVANKPKKR
jgi:hypothetical protein